MKRLLAMAAFLGLVAFSGALHAQEMGDDEKPADGTEQPKKDDGEAKKDDAKKDDRPQRRARQRMDRGAYQEVGRILREKDTDNDRKLSKDELGDADLFKKLDKDEDGSLTLQELLAGKDALVAAAEKEQQAVMKEEFGILDRDDSGKLSKEELGKDFEGLLEKGDTDKDGSLNLEEFTKARQGEQTDRAAGQRPDRGDIMGQLDKDKDGKISKEEAPDRMKQNFDKLDTDGDGFVTKEELEAALKNRMRPGQRPGNKGDAPKKEEEKKDDGESKEGTSKDKDDEF